VTAPARTRCLLLDLHDDPAAIARYRAHHAAGALPPEVAHAIRATGVTRMEIFLSGDRLVMLVEGGEGATGDPDPALAEWERRMDAFQAPLPWAEPGTKWTEAEPIFDLDAQPASTAQKGAGA
jgi:L-rhamnose mutarotase